MFRGKFRTIHFVGIGGIGMSGIAEVLLNLGFHVTGSDLQEGPVVKRLRGLGARISIGHRPEHLGEAEVLVRSTAVGEDNPEVAEALERRIPVIRRAEMLAELMRLKYGIAVGGSHGKTTTTSMLAACLAEGAFDPTVVIGGRVDALGGANAKLGGGDYLVAEADESDGSFLWLTPTVAMVTNIDPEHLDHYGSVDVLEETFLEFTNRVPFYGFSVLCQDHPTVQKLIPRLRRRAVTYGMGRSAQYRAGQVEPDGVRTRFNVYRHQDLLGEITLGMPGAHNVSNAVGAIAAALELSVPFDAVKRALDGFGGVQRRFSVRGEAQGVLVVDDYGHHPVEIRATLAATEAGFPDRRVIAVFQPHRYSRLEALWSDFCGAFNQADVVVVCPVYAAGEAPRTDLGAEAVAAAIRERGHHGAQPVDSLAHAVDWLAGQVRAGDVVVTLGAGDVHRVCTELLGRLEGTA